MRKLNWLWALAAMWLLSGCAGDGEECVPLPDRFDASTSLPKKCYLATVTPVIASGVTLTLEPGVKIIFTAGVGLYFGADQALVAAGTAAEPILLTGEQPVRGFWKGLTFESIASTENRLEYVTVEYGGSTTNDPNGAAVMVTSDSTPVHLSLSHVTLRESQGWGLYLVASTEAAVFAANTFTANTLGPVSVDSDVVGLLDAASSYTGNDVDEVRVRTNRVTKNASWAYLGLPYHLDGNLHVDVPWTLAAGNTLILAAEAWISVNDDGAALIAVGTAEAPILFTGEQQVRGYWDSLIFDASMNAANQLDHVILEYAGSTTSVPDNAGLVATSDSHGVTLSLTNTTVRESEGFGLFLAASAVTPTFASNTFTANTLGPADVASESAHLLEVSSTYTGNDVDRIRVRCNRVPETVTWQDLGLPYALDGNIHIDQVWTLAPGVTLIMARDGWISAASDAASLHAVGTAEAPILITGAEQTKGYWDSLIFDNSLNGSNAIEYATIEYGGSTALAESAMIEARSDSHGVALSVTNSTIQHSAQYGINRGRYAQGDVTTGNTFLDNDGGDVLQQP